jgi:flagellar basal-body rod modification protein FlgD
MTTTSNVGLIGASQATVKSAIGLADNFQNFLKLLTTQLQHQDPTKPLDATQFTTQLVQFASVEQQIGQNSRLDSLLKVQTGEQAVSATSFLGTQVEAFGNKFPVANGSGEFGYSLPSEAKSLKITIKDANGNIVRTLDTELDASHLTAGQHKVAWDGKDDQGVAVKDGNYTFEVSAYDADKKAIDAVGRIGGKVQGVTVEDGVLVLDLGGVKVKVTDVVSVVRPQDQTQTQS